ncbi:MAG TPA: HEPN domain-containing protein [Sedimentisphaerales bacterium]|nr:HEPN domain-containing protein [Sedimentisphaerales bacterium]
MLEDTEKRAEDATSPGQFDAQAVARHWFNEAQEALTVAGHLIEKGDYSYALFFGHLAVEKELKGLHAVRQNQHAPPIHNLLRLAKAAGLAPDESRTEVLIRITAFNIESRYPDFKRDFRRRCTPEYTAEQMTVIKEVLAWLKSHRM